MKKIIRYLTEKPWRLATALAAPAASLVLVYGGVASAQPTTSIASVASDRCVADRQDGNGATTSPGTSITLTSNVQYALTSKSEAWQRLKCTRLSFKVPKGQSANVALAYSGTFDAVQIDPSGNIVPNNPGWVEARFSVTLDTTPGGGSGGVLEILPDTEGRNTPQTLDNTSGGINNWTTTTVRASTRATCEAGSLPDFCTFNVQVDARMQQLATDFRYQNTVLTLMASNSGVAGTPSRNAVTP